MCVVCFRCRGRASTRSGSTPYSCCRGVRARKFNSFQLLKDFNLVVVVPSVVRWWSGGAYRSAVCLPACAVAGFKKGSILTVDPDEAKVLGPPWTRRYVYNHR